jgi:hypothetical protein
MAEKGLKSRNDSPLHSYLHTIAYNNPCETQQDGAKAL